MNYYFKKIIGLFTTVFIVSIITFFAFQMLPGDPATIMLGIEADPVQIENLREELNLNLPYFQRYLLWVEGIFRGDLGVSYRYSIPVMDLISSYFEVTFSLAILSLFFTIIIGFFVGLFISKHENNPVAKFIYTISQITISIPSFCMAILLISIFSVSLSWLPSFGYVSFLESPAEWLKGLILPSLSISLGTSAVLIRYIVVSIKKESKSAYVKTARSKGIPKNKILSRHILKNSLIPVITVLGMSVADVLGGSIIIEKVFSMAGIGSLIVTSINTRDLPLIQGLVFYLAILVVFTNFIVDILYSLIDPRIRLK